VAIPLRADMVLERRTNAVALSFGVTGAKSYLRKMLDIWYLEKNKKL